MLSDNKGFIWELYEHDRKANQKVLCINQDFTDNTAFIEPLEIAFSVKNKYFVSIKGTGSMDDQAGGKKERKNLGLI